ncbi:MAG: hypothetical protein V8Q73_12340 [Blautia sp.]
MEMTYESFVETLGSELLEATDTMEMICYSRKQNIHLHRGIGFC